MLLKEITCKLSYDSRFNKAEIVIQKSKHIVDIHKK